MDIEPIPPEAADAIERVRRLVRSLAAQAIQQCGVEPIDAALGIAYGLHDVATEVTGGPIGAIEWLRTFVDLAERGHITGGITVTTKGDGPG